LTQRTYLKYAVCNAIVLTCSVGYSLSRLTAKTVEQVVHKAWALFAKPSSFPSRVGLAAREFSSAAHKGLRRVLGS
jgi:hypothetical protein